ncbi:hypothetical protein F444_23071 [Phytophthora nicotianae P1976]|uniref:Uncharacterized protein n=1 Tax=Phytophthora nicotianae P1976 TaxID=1317066 RepID=A0A080YVZ1_PHYNI|nr:hypothetical protein F444_23071 [Phytophthora nicotianae P1976]
MYELFPEACDENDSSDDEADAEECAPIRIRSPVNVEQIRGSNTSFLSPQPSSRASTIRIPSTIS